MTDNRWDIVIRGARIFDGTGAAPFAGDLAVRGDRIAAVGEVEQALAATSKSMRAASRSRPALSTSIATTTSRC